MKKLKYLLLFIALVYMASCKESYIPTVTSTDANILVVDGYINTSTDSTIITLSRTVVVSAKNTIKPELNATVTIENDANVSYALKDLGKGTYAVSNLILDPAKKHRIRIKTTKGGVYLSDFVESRVAPAIDNISFEAKDDGVQFYVSAHDDSNNSKYYRWECLDTWQFHSNFHSTLKHDGTKIVDRISPDDDIYFCYAGGRSTNVMIGSSIKLSKDVINKGVLNFVEKGSEKISIRYSMLVKQYVLTKDAYEFWEKLRKNTEGLGSIFDAQPSQLTGNIHNTNNSEEPVIGYIGAGIPAQKRVFFDSGEFPRWTTVSPFYCITDTLRNNQEDIQKIIKGSYVAIERVSPVDQRIVAGAPQCVDCTIRGAKKKPSFW